MMYVYQDFSKGDKKQFDPLLTKAIQNEINQFLQKSFAKNQKIVSTKYEDIRKPYWELNDLFKIFSKHLMRTYDGWSHRDLPRMIVGFLIKEHLKQSDFKGGSPEGKEKLAEIEKHLKEW